MLKTGILNPAINALLAKVRHTNTLVIADRGFPFFPSIETVDISLVDDIPRVLDVLRAIRQNFVIGRVYMAQEFNTVNPPAAYAALIEACGGAQIVEESHVDLKLRVPSATGLIRTGDTMQYGNLIIESA
jgi:D-ribose pyranase